MTDKLEWASDLLVKAQQTLNKANRSARVDRLLLVIATVVFLAVTSVAVARLPPIEHPRWPLLVLGVVLGAVTFAVNGWEYAVIARALSTPTTIQQALRVSVLSSAANLLPLPGAVAVKVRELGREGRPIRQGLPAVTSAGVAWVSCALLLAAPAVAADAPLLSLSLGLLATLGLVGSYALLRTSPIERPLTSLLWIAGVEVVSVFVTATRLLVLLVFVGADRNVTDAMALALASVISSAVGLVPGGLGIRELLSAAAGLVVEIPPAVSVTVTALDRVLLAVALAVLAGALSIRREPHAAREQLP